MSMWTRTRYHAGVLAGMLLLSSLAMAASKNFVPDVVFKGSSLTGWRTLGQAEWRAQNGEVVGTARAGGNGGWLVLDKSYQDVAFFASYRCSAGCKTGVLLRGEKTSDGGMKGIYVSLTEGDLASYRVTLDAQGTETSRQRLRSPGGGQVRVAPPPNPAPAAAGGGGGGGGPTPMPPGIPSPITRNTAFRPGDWNTIELMLDANIVRPFLNDDTAVSAG